MFSNIAKRTTTQALRSSTSTLINHPQRFFSSKKTTAGEWVSGELGKGFVFSFFFFILINLNHYRVIYADACLLFISLFSCFFLILYWNMFFVLFFSF